MVSDSDWDVGSENGNGNPSGILRRFIIGTGADLGQAYARDQSLLLI